MARVLVLGGTSYVAQFLLQQIQQGKTLQVAGDRSNAAEEVSAVACTIRSSPFAPLPDGFVTAESDLAVETKARNVCVYWEVDIADVGALRTCIMHFRPSVVINCTAISSPAMCQRHPDEARSINEPRGLVNLLEAMPWRLRFVHFSTDFVYDGLQQSGESYGENAAVATPLLSEYGASKLRFDQYLLGKKTTANLQVIILRIANVVGPQAPLLPDRSAPKFMQWLHHQLFPDDNTNDTPQPPLTLWYDEYRSYLYVYDLVAVTFLLLAIEFKAGTSLFNVGGEDALSRVNIAERYLAACTKLHPKTTTAVLTEMVPTSRAEIDMGYPSPLNTRLNTTRLKQQLPKFAWTPTTRFLEEISCSFLC